jgi:GDP-D-mannose 3', 5'-epimerase
MLESASLQGLSRYFFSASACRYPAHLQTEADVTPLKEEDAHPPTPAHLRCEKPVSERLCEYYADELGMQTKVVRFHNIYGPYGTYNGGREKAPAALCHKAAKAKPSARSSYAATASRPARSATTTAWRASTG